LNINVEKPKRETQFLAPRNAVEAQLAEIWTESLGISPIGINDNFFELGGHSLLASKVISRACDAFKVNIPLRKIFEEPTIASLSLAIEQGSRFMPKIQPRAIKPVPRGTQSLDNFLQDADHLSMEQIVNFLDSEDTKR
jgi:acyl carrier protein